MTQASDTVAIYGLGNMGYPLAERIGRKFSVQVFDLNADAISRARHDFGASEIHGPEDLIDTRTVLLCLADPRISLKVMGQVAAHVPRGSVFIEASTVNPEHIHVQRSLLTPFGHDVIDASIMGGWRRWREARPHWL